MRSTTGIPGFERCAYAVRVPVRPAQYYGVPPLIHGARANTTTPPNVSLQRSCFEGMATAKDLYTGYKMANAINEHFRPALTEGNAPHDGNQV